MEKLVYVAWKKRGDAIGDFRKQLIDELGPRLLELGVRKLTITVADLKEAIGPHSAMKIMGEGETISAAISLWMDSLDDRHPIEAALHSIASRLAGYLVTESIPLACTDRDWPDGQRSPGVTHFTAFPKPERISDEQFYEAWHGSHTPLSFELHPRRWQYVRNAVARSITVGASPWRAIVEERFRVLEDYTDPKRFFGSTDVVERMLGDLKQFADIEQMDSVPMSEYILKS